MPSAPSTTDLLYALDAYRREFDAEVLAVDHPSRAVALTSTAFFPTGGGQPNDTGTLVLATGAVKVSDVVKDRDGCGTH